MDSPISIAFQLLKAGSWSSICFFGTLKRVLKHIDTDQPQLPFAPHVFERNE
jgi:hypothetical protein